MKKVTRLENVELCVQLTPSYVAGGRYRQVLQVVVLWADVKYSYLQTETATHEIYNSPTIGRSHLQINQLARL